MSKITQNRDQEESMIIDILISGDFEHHFVGYNVRPCVARMNIRHELRICFSYNGYRYMASSENYNFDDYDANQLSSITHKIYKMVFSGEIEKYLNIRFLL